MHLNGITSMEPYIEEIEKWALERHFDVLTFNKKDWLKNIQEEHLEPLEFILDGGIASKIWKENLDSLIDQFVYTIADTVKKDFNIEPVIHNNIIRYMFTNIELYCIFYNVDLDCAFGEVLKEINSREQDPEQAKGGSESVQADGKWKKNAKQDPNTLYKANFELCRIIK